jgi:hypothetical protein
MVNMTVNVIATFGIGEGSLDKEALHMMTYWTHSGCP